MDAGAVDGDLEPVDDADDALAGKIAKLRHDRQSTHLGPRRLGDGPRHGVLARVLDRAGEPKHVRA